MISLILENKREYALTLLSGMTLSYNNDESNNSLLLTVAIYLMNTHLSLRDERNRQRLKLKRQTKHEQRGRKAKLRATKQFYLIIK